MPIMRIIRWSQRINIFFTFLLLSSLFIYFVWYPGVEPFLWNSNNLSLELEVMVMFWCWTGCISIIWWNSEKQLKLFKFKLGKYFLHYLYDPFIYLYNNIRPWLFLWMFDCVGPLQVKSCSLLLEGEGKMRLAWHY